MARRDLLTISEFSKLTGIPRSKLIYYDEIGLFAPAVRGENNYRYYTLNQIVFTGFINDLASFDIPLKELTTLIRRRSPEAMIELFEKEIEGHQKKIAEHRDTQNAMEAMIELMQLGLDAEGADIEVREYKPGNIILGGENILQDATNFYPAWISFMNASKRAGISLKYPVGGYFENLDRFLTNPSLPSRFYFVNPRGKHVRGGGLWLAGYVHGFYGQTGDLPQRMKAYAKKHRLKLTGPVYNTFLLDEMSIVDPDKYLMRASIKIVEK